MRRGLGEENPGELGDKARTDEDNFFYLFYLGLDGYLSHSEIVIVIFGLRIKAVRSPRRRVRWFRDRTGL